MRVPRISPVYFFNDTIYICIYICRRGGEIKVEVKAGRGAMMGGGTRRGYIVRALCHCIVTTGNRSREIDNMMKSQWLGSW